MLNPPRLTDNHVDKLTEWFTFGYDPEATLRSAVAKYTVRIKSGSTRIHQRCVHLDRIMLTICDAQAAITIKHGQ